jgi:hypothetical protein
MKNFLTLIIALILSSTVNAQFLKLLDKNTNSDITGQSNLIFFGNNQTSYDFSAKIKNISSNSQDIKVRRIYEERLNGSYDFYCWDLCFDSLVSNSGIITLAAGASDSTSFHSTYYSGGSNGVSRIRFKFFTDNNPNDTASFVIHFTTTPSGIQEQQNSGLIAGVGPIPADEQINVHMNRAGNNVQVQLLDMSGRIVSSEQVNKIGNHPINTASLSPGIYLLQVSENNLITDQVKVILQ